MPALGGGGHRHREAESTMQIRASGLGWLSVVVPSCAPQAYARPTSQRGPRETPPAMQWGGIEGEADTFHMPTDPKKRS